MQRTATLPSLGEQASALLGRLVRIDTVNPPGHERPAQELLAQLLADAGFACELLSAEPERPNLIARLDGVEPGPTLCLLGHTDTVLADPDEWSHDPWSGDLADGFIWGRGAIDMKSQVAAEVIAGASLAAGGWRPARGALLIVAVADEETGGELGAKWLTETHPEKVRCDMLLNEGAGQCFSYGGRRRYGVCCAEKGVFRFTLTTRGVAAHASTPRMGENALLKMAPLLGRLAQRNPSYLLSDQARALLVGLGEDPQDPIAAVRHIGAEDARLLPLIEPILGVTLSPTRISASEKINVIPSAARLRIDCRVPPGFGEQAVRAAIAEVLGDEQQDGFQIEFTEQVEGNSSPTTSPLMDAISGWIAEHDPGASTVPTAMPGFTDSRHFRAAFPECVAYGFFPQRHQSLLEAWPLIHSANERINVRDLELATQCYRDLVVRLLG
ncbi:MAG TPA: M20/M25/M40 family metallo-hydrolase [Solirubrobacteraceae bacterium]|nr:M20/M25/M40 family metallo-hydrolase [Solirubrobacteraceae bacterium]